MSVQKADQKRKTKGIHDARKRVAAAAPGTIDYLRENKLEEYADPSPVKDPVKVKASVWKGNVNVWSGKTRNK